MDYPWARRDASPCSRVVSVSASKRSGWLIPFFPHLGHLYFPSISKSSLPSWSYMFHVATWWCPGDFNRRGSSYGIELRTRHWGLLSDLVSRFTCTMLWQLAQRHGKKHVVVKFIMPPPISMSVCKPHSHIAVTCDPMCLSPEQLGEYRKLRKKIKYLTHVFLILVS